MTPSRKDRNPHHRRGASVATPTATRLPAVAAATPATCLRAVAAAPSAHRPRALAAVLLACVAILAALASSAGAAANPVLGSQRFTGPYGEGFGTAEPSSIFNGGDPSGSVSKIDWSGWGNPSAIGYGLNPIFKPGGGYFRKPARIELRATALGRCGTVRAYTRLEVRLPRHPGGKLGKWLLWSGAKSICKPPY